MARHLAIRTAWCALVVALVLFLPASIIGFFPFWSAAREDIWFVAGLAGVFVAGFLVEIASNHLPALPKIYNRFSVTCLGTAGIFAAALMLRSHQFSRLLVVVATLLVAIGVTAPELWRLSKRAKIAVGVLSLALLAAGSLATVMIHPDVVPPAQTKTIAASQHSLAATYYSGYIEPEPQIARRGGAIASDPGGDGYVVVTPRGDFYRISWNASDQLVAARLGLRAPINDREFEADGNASITDRFRVADLLLRRQGNDTQAFVSHHYWKREDRCVVVRVSAVTLPPLDRVPKVSEPMWHTVFESTPCLPLPIERVPAFAGEQIGGNLEQLASGQLLLTLGDHQFDGWFTTRNVIQDPDADYGKTLLIDPQTGTKTVFTVGHRNPQGLVVARDGRIWETEHGPQGGDELNLLVAGGNYGWPYRTFGTDYGGVTWPLSGKEPVASVFIDPVFAWVPSIGVSELVEVDDPAFPRWQGDLLVSSLAGKALWRVRIRHDRVEYAEPIEIGERIRDVAVGHGEFVLWTDSGTIVRIRPQATLDDGAALFTVHCGTCHDDSANRIGPTLRHFLSRHVGSVEGYDYSPALRQLGGKWTDERLDKFLAEPASVAPGTRMMIQGVADPTARNRIIAYLKQFDR
jgi:aldose sugar dehydrogenase